MALVASGEPVLVLVACDERRVRQLRGRLGGFALCSWDALEREPGLADSWAHLVALDPPQSDAQEALLRRGTDVQMAHLAWGEPELRFTQDVLEHDYEPRAALAELYRTLRAAAGASLEDVLRGPAPGVRTAAQAGRGLRVLLELGPRRARPRDARVLAFPTPARRELEESAAHRAYLTRLEARRQWMSPAARRAA